jgi:hypothetical protein
MRALQNSRSTIGRLGDLLSVMTIPADLAIGGSKSIAVRGQREQVAAHTVGHA